MLATAQSCCLTGLEGRPITVEVDISEGGLPGVTVVGLPDASVQEARERVRSAIRSCRLNLPGRRITINLAPAQLRKEGPGFDLAMAVAVLVAMREAKAPPAGAAFLGQLSLDGRVRHVDGVLPCALALRDHGASEIYVAPEDAAEAALVAGLAVRGVPSLAALRDHLDGGRPLPVVEGRLPARARGAGGPDLADVVGQEGARRALEMAAAGGHNLLMVGPPGCGKTLLASCLPGVLPPLDLAESFAVSQVYSVRGRLPRDIPLVTVRPFRAPHHTVSYAGMFGGGSPPRPGEVSLAHGGVLFLDELAEFHRDVLEALREPLESGVATLTRASGTLTYPAAFQLVAATNPCPCGLAGLPGAACSCAEGARTGYLRRLSGPVRDRLDLVVGVGRADLRQFNRRRRAESSESVAERVALARERQLRRLGPGLCNARIPVAALDELVAATGDARNLLVRAGLALGISGRGYHRTLRLGRTVADLEGSEAVTGDHVAQALEFRGERVLAA
ncbi:MAG: YifB family Mg chelatase-like AAA ATPase [Candidatus Dormibacteria bacterium]